MKALSIKQPYASLIINGQKRYETRDWATNFRGLVAIHASKGWGREEQNDLKRLLCQRPDELERYRLYEFPLGAVLGVCRLIACHRAEDIRDDLEPLERAVGGYADGRFAFELEIVKLPPEPIPAKGQLGFWEWNVAVADTK